MLLAGCAQPAPKAPTYRIGFSQLSLTGNWRQEMLAGVERELGFHPEVELRMLNAEDNSTRQIQQIRELLDGGIDLLIVSPYEAAPLTPVVEEAMSRGVPVVLMDRRINSSRYTAFVGGNNLGVGQIAANYAARLLHGRGEVVEILGLPGSSAVTGRQEGFRQGLVAHPGLRLVGTVVGNWQEKTLKPGLTAMLRAHPDVKLIFSHNDVMANSVSEVCQQLGRKDIKIIGVDALPGEGQGIDLVQQEIITASIVYSPGGEEAIRTALKILKKRPFKRENILSTIVIDSTNVLTMQQQHEKMESQNRDIERQHALLQTLRSTYASQQTVLRWLLASLLGALVLGAVALHSARRNRQINRELAVQNAANDAINRQLVAQNEEIRTQGQQLDALARKSLADTEAKLRFFTNFSHELRTPLTLILGPVEELLTSTPDLSSAQRHDLGLVRRNTQRLLHLVNQLLDFRKIEVGKMLVRAAHSDLVAFVREIAEAFEQPARRRGIRLRVEAEPAELLAWFDGNILDKIFFNLLSNALKFTPDGGRITVDVRATDQGRAWQVRVADTGPGIGEADRARIFEWFYQGDAGVQAKGSGMGLALSLGLARLHLGDMGFTSEPGRGAAFFVSAPCQLPAALGAEAGAPAERPAPAPDEPEALPPLLAPARPAEGEGDTLVLVIEDNADVSAFVAQKLGTAFRVETAADGLAGLALALDLIPDLIVCDVMMPGLSGLEVVARLRADWRTSHVPVVLLTARAAAEQQLEGVRAGADLYLTKPFQPAFLLESVRTLLANRQRQRAHARRERAADLPAAASGPDRDFLGDLTAIVEANLTKTDLTAEDVARSLGISRLQLHRKLQALLGTGVSDFVQGLRLAKARELLLDDTLALAEVAAELGFASPAYFATSFQARYQLSPAEFRLRRGNLVA